MIGNFTLIIHNFSVFVKTKSCSKLLLLMQLAYIGKENLVITNRKSKTDGRKAQKCTVTMCKAQCAECNTKQKKTENFVYFLFQLFV